MPVSTAAGCRWPRPRPLKFKLTHGQLLGKIRAALRYLSVALVLLASCSLQSHYSQKSDETERIKGLTERLLCNVPLIETARYFMALGEQGKLDFFRANPDLCDALEQAIESGESN